MARCTACDTVLMPYEIVWEEEAKRFSLLCNKCEHAAGVYEVLEEKEEEDETTDSVIDK